MKNSIDFIDQKIIFLITQGNQVNDISETISRSKRYILYRLSDLKITFNCKTTSQLIYTLMNEGVIK